MWVIDIQHWLNDEKDGPAVLALKSKVDKLKEIIIYATTALSGHEELSAPACKRRPQKKRCNGVLDAAVVDIDEIHWVCPVCGDEGIVRGWTGLVWDMLDIENDVCH